MPKARDWSSMRDMSMRLLEERTGKPLASWNRRVAAQKTKDERALRVWLAKEGVTGYAAELLVMERFGYPDFMTASAEELIDAQYEDRPALRPIFDALVEAAVACGEVEVQARKTYVSLVAQRRTFARIQASTRTRVDMGLRLEKAKAGGRLKRSRIHESMPLQLEFTSTDDVDAEALRWIEQAYAESA